MKTEQSGTGRTFVRMQWRVLIATMVGYTLFYFMRKNFSFAMLGLEQDCGVSKSTLGNFLLAGGLVYGVAKFLFGFVGDRVNSRKMLCFGLAACALVNVAFGFVPDLFSGPAMLWAFGGLLVLSQLFQATGFPPCARLIAFWVPPQELATKMSVWNTSHSIGGGLVAQVCGVIMGLGILGAKQQGIGMWRWCFWSMALLGGLGLLLMWVWLPGTPDEEGVPTPDELNAAPVVSGSPQGESAEKRPSAMKMVFMNPVIWALGCCNFTINATRSLVADWGPTLLQQGKGFNPAESGTVIMFFEFAGIAGMLFAGWATDRFFAGKAPRLCVFLMVLTAGLLALFWWLPPGLCGAIALCGAGFCLYGPQALTGVTATNIATKSLTGTAIGFISLFSYVGVSISGKVCGTLAQHYQGWAAPVFAICGTAVCSAMFFLSLWRTKAHNYG